MSIAVAERPIFADRIPYPIQLPRESFESYRPSPEPRKPASRPVTLDVPSITTEEPKDIVSVQSTFTNLAPEKVSAQGTAHYQSRARIYVLGGTRLGKFIAHSLASITEPPPVTLLSHMPFKVQQWFTEGCAMEVIDTKGVSCVQRDIDVEWTKASPREALRSRKHPDSQSSVRNVLEEMRIDKLIVALPATRISGALHEIRHRLGPMSTICFTDNTMGILEEINEKVFPNILTRPRYMIASSTHLIGAADNRSYTTIQIRKGKLHFSLLPAPEISGQGNGNSKEFLVRPASYGWTSSSKSLMRTLTRAPALDATGFKYRDMVARKVEQLALNALIGPFSVIFQCENAGLVRNRFLDLLIQKVLDEIVVVIQHLPELRSSERLDNQLTSLSLKLRFLAIVKRSGKDASWMLQDVRAGRETDIDYVNGYFIKRGEELGIACPVNRAIVDMVKAKQLMESRKEQGYIPFERRT